MPYCITQSDKPVSFPIKPEMVPYMEIFTVNAFVHLKFAGS